MDWGTNNVGMGIEIGRVVTINNDGIGDSYHSDFRTQGKHCICGCRHGGVVWLGKGFVNSSDGVV